MAGWFRRGCAVLGLAALAAGLAGCGDGLKKLEEQTVPRENIVSVNIVSDMGGVTVTPTKGDVIRVSPACKVTAASRERRELIEENLLVTSSVDEQGLLTVYARLSDAVTLDKDGEEAVRLDVAVEIPPQLGSVVVQAQKGDIALEGLKGIEALLIGSEGDITVTDTTLVGASAMNTVLGDVTVKLKNIDAADSITAATDMGDVRFNVPKSASYTVTKEELSQQGTSWKNKTGKTALRLSSKVGRVYFQK